MMNLVVMILFTIHAGYSMRGGSTVEPGEFNYIASIQIKKSHRCSGVIIHENHIITVAHRIADFAVQDLAIIVGKSVMYFRSATKHLVKEVFFHPGFRRRNSVGHQDDAYYHDIAVLRLEQKLIWTPFISPVSLVDIPHNSGYDLDCILISWNFPEDRRSPMILKWRLIKLITNEVHQQWAKYLEKDQKNFSDYFGTAAIGVEDVGSPLICGNIMTGLVSRGQQVDIPGKPSIVMPIAPYLEFIDDTIYDGLFEVKLGEFRYVATIRYNDIYACGGFIVDATHVATVGHCVKTYEMGNFTVVVGHPPQIFSLANIAIHPNYGVETTDVSPNWYIEHDFALLTLQKTILWNQWTSPLPLSFSNDFHVGQLCKLLRQKYYRDEVTGAEFMRLMFSRVIISDNECSQPQLNPQSQVPSFWGESQYLTPIAGHKDVGYPIICDGNPVGFLIQAIPLDGDTTALLARFLKIHPYIECRSSSWLHDMEQKSCPNL